MSCSLSAGFNLKPNSCPLIARVFMPGGSHPPGTCVSSRRDGSNISSKLAADGGEILQQTGNPSTGFYVRYRRGHTLGEARIMPPQIIQPDLVDRRGVSSGEVALNLRISLKERWYASEADTLAQASTSSSDPGI